MIWRVQHTKPLASGRASSSAGRHAVPTQALGRPFSLSGIMAGRWPTFLSASAPASSRTKRYFPSMAT